LKRQNVAITEIRKELELFAFSQKSGTGLPYGYQRSCIERKIRTILEKAQRKQVMSK
jgi:hypothetical protein